MCKIDTVFPEMELVKGEVVSEEDGKSAV